MGEIVYNGIIRTAVTIAFLWFISDSISEKYFWIVAGIAIYIFIIHPIILSYRKFIDKNKDILTNSLCSTCKHFSETAVLCMKYDEYPTEKYTPCNGYDWEKK
jgi:hypothetical protein